MADQGKGSKKWATTLAGLAVAVVVAGAVSLGVVPSMKQKAPEPAPVQADAPVGVMALDFAPGQVQLPDPAHELLSRVADAARQDPTLMLRIAGFYDGAPSAPNSLAVARNRVDAVRHALEANGVAPRQMHLPEPIASPGSARRVEIDTRP